jgi:formiminoglutamase
VGEAISLVNLDAHPDVRPTLREGEREQGHSGSPFRQAIEHPSRLCRSYAVTGLQPSAVSTEALRWLREHGCTARFIDEPGVAEDPLGALPPWRQGAAETPIMASLDLDAVMAAAAPGVSAPSPAGLTPTAWLAAAERLGADPRVRSIDLVELCPRLDPGELATRLAAVTVWRILRGAAGRGGS